MSKNPERKAQFRALINDVLTDIMVASTTDNIYVDKAGTLLSDYLTRLVLTEDMEQALAQLKAEIVDGAPEILNTLKEISDWIEEHGDFTQYLEELVSTKADKSEVEEVANRLEILLNAFSAAPTIYYSDEQPSNLKSGDLWVQPVTDASVLQSLVTT